MKRTYVAVIEYRGKEVLRSGEMELHLARMAIASWKADHPEKVNVLLRCWLETMSLPPTLPPYKTKRWTGESEQEKTVEKYLK